MSSNVLPEDTIIKKCPVAVPFCLHLKCMDPSENIKKEQPNNPLHGIKLEDILIYLEGRFGWEYLGAKIDIRCFNYDPSVKSSLKFLRKTPWARTKVEEFYVRAITQS